MKKQLVFPFAFAAKAGISLLVLALLAACGDEVTQINQTGLEVVASEDDLPKCTKDNEGEQTYVKGESFARVCDGEDWVALDGSGNSDFSCKTVELKDKSGLKIVCNGDSIGVVLNGSDGKQGEAGKDGKDGEDGKDAEIAQPDTLEADSEKILTPLDSLAGFTQKGPFLKGSTVYLYELSDGRTLKQTNGNFTSKITSDDGHYKFTARDLVSQYAMVVVDGYYRNEVTGTDSDAPIRLTALTDMRKRSSVNVNLLTHMEFDRVYNLVTREDSTGKKLTVKKAKHQAQKEILSQFHIDLGDTTDAEDMDVFGKTDADAALLAVSVLLQGDGSSSDLSVLLTEISNDIAEHGVWRDADAKMHLAEWAMRMDDGSRRFFDNALISSDAPNGKFPAIREHVRDWHLSDTVPDFEKYIRNFYSTQTGLGTCGSASIPEGTVKEISKDKRSSYFAKTFADTSKSKERFICADAKSGRWRFAKDIEKDTATWDQNAKEGDLRKGRVTGTTYVYESSKKAWRRATITEATLGLCRSEIEDSIGYANVEYQKIQNGDTTYWTSPGGPYYLICKSGKWERATDLQANTYRQECSEFGQIVHGRVNADNLYFCYDDGWRLFYGNENVTYGRLEDGRDEQVYRIVQIAGKTVMAENLNFDYTITDSEGAEVSFGNRCRMGTITNMSGGETCEYGRFYSWAAAMDSAAVFTDSSAECGDGKTCKVKLPVRGVCPEGWHIPTQAEWENWIGAIEGVPYSLQATGYGLFPQATDVTGFDAIPAGYYMYLASTFFGSTIPTFWTASEASVNSAYYLSIDNESASANTMQKNNQVPVRCFKD